MTLLDLKTADIAAVRRELETKVASSPAFFKNSAIVFGFDALTDAQQTELKLTELKDLCLALNLIPAATRGGNQTLQEQSLALGLANLPKIKDRTTPVRDVADAAQEPVQETAQETAPAGQQVTGPTKVVSAPVRSGQQIYAPDGDLIILTSVSAGAEVLADGNIHIYGPLRGRALAGIKGNEQARIFCGSQEAELVSIAGHFLVDEILRENQWKEACQIFIEDGSIKIETLYNT